MTDQPTVAGAGRQQDALQLAIGLTAHWEAHGQYLAGRDTIESALAAGDPAAEDRAAAYGALATLATAQGDLAAAVDFHRQAADLYAGSGHQRAATASTHALAAVLLRAGEREAAEAAAIEALRRAERLGDERAQAFARSVLGLVAAADGRPDEGFVHLLASLEAFRAQDARHEAASVLANLGNVADDIGDRQRATRFYDGATQLFDAVGDRRGAALCLNNSALLAAAHGDLDQAIELGRRALDHFSAMGDLHGEAAVLNNLAGWWEEHGAVTEAATLYEQAIARFDRLQAVDNRATAQRNLDGLRPPPPELSRRELQVAELVAAGLSNREIAAQLFISERTVHSHLSHIFTKLDLRSRTQLGRWVGRRREAADPDRVTA